MPTLQVRDLPQELYNQLAFIAEKEHRSLAQETIILLKEGIESRLDNRERRKQLLKEFEGLGMDTDQLPTPEQMVREDRDSR
ncbi:MAG: Arc family DNA-binding protein [Spirochaeta sp.]